MDNQVQSVGNAELVKMKKIVGRNDGNSVLAFLWAGFDDVERRRVCYLASVSVVEGSGENAISRDVADWRRFSAAERSRLNAALEKIARWGVRIEKARQRGAVQ